VAESPIVIDASIALRWLLPDALSAACWRLFEQAANASARIQVPTLWIYEMASGLSKAVFFKSISPDEARKSLTQVFTLEAEIVEATELLSQQAFEWTLRLNRATTYDSYYLAVAELAGCEFWTADRRLYNACHTANLDWVHWVEEA
jgi:predicted nucleic acid-binding protein